MKKMYTSVLWFLTRKFFKLWQALGLHVLPNHFYSPIPDTRDLKMDIWSKKSDLSHIQMSDEFQYNFLSKLSKYKNEYDLFPVDKVPAPHEYYINNNSFESVDAEILYSTIRYYKPKKIIEIGSGFSTFLIAKAILKNIEENDDYDCEFVVIDPYPNKVIKTTFPGVKKVIPKKIQDIPISFFKALKENDILFIDSSHSLKIGGDVHYEFCEILPQLHKGVIIHIHDIFLPYEYPKEWILESYFFWTEQYLLQAFLTLNKSFEVLWGGHFMHKDHPHILEKTFLNYDKNKRRPSSFWIKKIK